MYYICTKLMIFMFDDNLDEYSVIIDSETFNNDFDDIDLFGTIKESSEDSDINFE